MVAVITGTGFGQERGSGWILGSRGQLGSSAFGRYGENVTVNASTGNLMINRTDEVLIGLGQDAVVERSYNSLDAATDNNGNNWRIGAARKAISLTGTVNTSGSTLTRIDWDGSNTLYTYDTSRGLYVGKQGVGAFDTIVFVPGDGETTVDTWVWTDGNSRQQETYQAGTAGRLLTSVDTSGNTTAYSWSGADLVAITTPSEQITLTWSGDNLMSVTTSKSGGATLTRVRYTYDSSNRLSTVTTDLSPDDNSISDGNTVVTTYTYDGTSKRVASISQTGGASLSIAYDGSNRVSSYTQTLASGVTRTTSFTYGSGYTQVTDPLGNTTKLTYDTNGQLTRIDYPPAVSGATAEYITYTYDSDGNVATATDGLGNVTTYGYDANGNMTLLRYANGNTVTWTYSSDNQLLTRTEYTVRDDDGSGPHLPSGATTTRYTYDSADRLRYVVDELGDVTEYKYNSNGTQSAAIVYRDNTYNISGLAITDTISESSLNSWVSGISDKSTSERTDFTYDFRGNLATVTTYSATSSAGAGLTTSPYTVVTYTYDQFGNLLTRQTSGIANTETFVYDGLGRMTSAVDLNGTTTTYAFNNSTNVTTITMASGLVETSTYDLAGRLITQQESHTGTGSSSSVASATTSYAYDKDGNLRMVTDAFGNKHYYLYDALNRKIADISPDGEITEYRYDLADRHNVTIRYATLLSSTALASLVDGSGNPATVTLASVLPAQSTDSTNPDQWNWTVYDTRSRAYNTADSDGQAQGMGLDGKSQITSEILSGSLLSSTVISGLKTTPPTTTQIPSLDSTKDFHPINYYDAAGNLIGTLTVSALTGSVYTGTVTQFVYDAAGELVEKIDYAGTGTYDASFSNVLSSLTTGAQDLHTRYFYDDQGHLQYSLDSQLHATQYVYDNAGRVSRAIVYDTAIASTTTYTLAYVASQVSGFSSHTANRIVWNVYDPNTGNLAYTIDSQGDVVANVYDSYGRLIKQTAYATQATSANLSSASISSTPTTTNMASWVSTNAGSNDRLSRVYYDEKGRVAYTIDALGYVTHVTYDKADRVLSTYRYPATYSATDSTTLANLDTNYATPPTDTVQTTNVYDADGRLSDSYDGLGIRTRFTYNALDRVATKTVAYGTSDASTTTYQYSSAGHLVSETVASGTSAAATTSFTYNGRGLVLTQTDPDGHTTTLTYDSHLRVTTRTDATGAVTSYLYDNFGNLLQTTDPLGNKTYAFYDTLNRVILTVDAEGYAVGTSYDAFGGISSVTRYATKITATITPGTLPTVTTNAADATTSFTYDKLGRAVASTDAEGFSDATTYNAFGNKASYTGKSSTASTGGAGGTITYVYDKRGLLVSETLPTSSSVDGGATITNTFTYDARGNRTQMVEASGRSEARTTNYAYDKADNLLTTAVINVPIVATDLSTTSTVTATVTNVYDSRGNIIKTTDADGNPTFFFYDAQDRKIAQINALGIMSKWTYDAAGNVTAQRVYGDTFTLPTSPGGTPPSTSSTNYRETTYTYDNDNRLLTTTVASVRVWQNGMTGLPTSSSIVITNHYDAFGNLTYQTDGNGNNVWYWYDKRGNKVAQVDQELYLTTYALDADGNVTTETRYATKLGTAPGTPPSTTVPSVTADSAHDRVTNFTYTKTGLRKTEQRTNVDIASVSAGTGDPTVTTGSATITYTYNGLGEVLTKQEATGDTTTYTYDTGGHQLTSTSASFTGSTGSTVSTVVAMTYDGLNNLKTSVENSSRTTTYTYDAAGRVATMQDASGFTRTYQYDANGNTLKVSYSRLKSDGSTVTEASATRYDALGRAVYVTAASLSGSTWTTGDITTMTYDAWGEVTARAINSVTEETNAYDNAGHLYRSTAGDGVVKFYLNDANGNQTAVITSDGKTLAGSYSWSTVSLDTLLGLLIPGSGYTLGSTAVAGTVTTIATYDKRGQTASTIEPGRQLSSTTTATLTHSQTHNAFGEVSSQTDALGNTTTYTYNTMGKVTSVTLPAITYVDATGTSHSSVSPVSYTYYDASGRVVATKDANGNVNKRVLLAGTGYGGTDALAVTEYRADGGVWVSYYDANKDLVKKNVNGVSGAGEVDETYTYDAMDRLLTETHPTRAAGSAGNATGSAQTLVDTYAYDGLGQRIKHHNSFILSGSTPIDETTDYDLQGRVIKTVDMDGHTTTYSYTWSASATATGLLNAGGWVKATTNSSGLTYSETDDVFGRQLTHTEIGGNVWTYTFDLAGRQLSNYWASDPDSSTTTYSWYNTGNLASTVTGYQHGNWGNTLVNKTHHTYAHLVTATYAYDANGNRTAEGYNSLIFDSAIDHYDPDSGQAVWLQNGPGPQVLQNATATYDADGRRTAISDSGDLAPMSIAYSYDLAGNIRRMQSTFRTLDADGNVSSTTTSEDYWYKYDAMNRFITTKGTLSGGAVVRGSTGSDIAYNYDGTRATVVNGTDSTSEAYTYTADGLLAQVSIGGVIRARYSYDTLGRTVEYDEYSTAGYSTSTDNRVYWRDNITYDAASLLQTDRTTSKRGSDTYVASSTYGYNQLGWTGSTYNYATETFTGAYMGGVVTHVSTTNTKNGTATPTTDTANQYGWSGTRAIQLEQYYVPDTAHGTSYNVTGYIYDNNGGLKQAQVADGAARTIDYINDSFGQVMKRDQSGGYSTGGTPHEIRYYFGGMQVGDVSNNGTSDTDYAQSIAAHTAAIPTSPGNFRGGATTPTSYANFDLTYNPVNGDSQSGTASAYTAAAGDTLQSIAQAVYGDAALWYVIADANGLSASDTIAAGQVLSIPANVSNIHNTSGVFRVYDPNQAIGDIAPTVPKAAQPKHNNCGIFGQIILAVVAIAVTILTFNPVSAYIGGLLGDTAGVIIGGAVAGAAGSIVSQGVGLVTGIQNKFDWGSVATAAIGGAVGGAIGPGGLFGDPGLIGNVTGVTAIDAGIRAAVGSVITQGVEVATGLQKKFDWAGVAAAAVGGGVASYVGDAIGFDPNMAESNPQYVSNTILGGIAGAAGAIANAATRTLVNGTDFGDNIMAALPDTIGNTIGTLLAHGLRGVGPGLSESGSGPIEHVVITPAQSASDYYATAAAMLQGWNALISGRMITKVAYFNMNDYEATVPGELEYINGGAASQTDPYGQIETVVVNAESIVEQSRNAVVFGVAAANNERFIQRSSTASGYPAMSQADMAALFQGDNRYGKMSLLTTGRIPGSQIVSFDGADYAYGHLPPIAEFRNYSYDPLLDRSITAQRLNMIADNPIGAVFYAEAAILGADNRQKDNALAFGSMFDALSMGGGVGQVTRNSRSTIEPEAMEGLTPKPLGPTEAYDRDLHYGRTPTRADRAALGAGLGEVVDHTPPLVQRYYEGDPAIGEMPGWMMTPEQRAASAADQLRMQIQSAADSNSQGGQMSAYSRAMRRKHGL